MRFILISLAIICCSLSYASTKTPDLSYVLDTINNIRPKIEQSAQSVKMLGELVNTENLAQILKYDANLRRLLEVESLRGLDSMSHEELAIFLDSVVVFCGVDMNPINKLMEQITGVYVKAAMTYFDNSIYSKSGLQYVDKISANLLAHEIIHGLQERGTVSVNGLNQVESYLVNYILASIDTINLGKSYLNNRYEIEAYRVGGRHWSYLDKYMGQWYR